MIASQREEPVLVWVNMPEIEECQIFTVTQGDYKSSLWSLNLVVALP